MITRRLEVGRDRRQWAESAPLETLLDWAVGWTTPKSLAVATSFGPAGLVVLEALSRLGHRLPVVFVDTLFHFPETIEHVERVRALYDLDLRIYRPAESREEFERQHGPELWRRDLDLYQRLVKVEPARAARASLEAWITGRRREQAFSRTGLPVLAHELDGFVTINPLARWDRRRVWTRITERGIPYNPLHDRGYASIGDEPLTTPVQPGEHERAGRWRGHARFECGMHSG